MSYEQDVRDAIMAAMKKAGVQGLMRATVFAHLTLPPAPKPKDGAVAEALSNLVAHETHLLPRGMAERDGRAICAAYRSLLAKCGGTNCKNSCCRARICP